MGVERIIRTGDETVVEWPSIQARLLAIGETPALRMIDGELAFPDEIPANEWQELRIALHGGMVTLRRVTRGIACITWGNADDELKQSWNALTWAAADTANSLIQEESREVTAADFAREHRLIVD